MSTRLPNGWETSTLGEVCEINPPRKEIASLPDDLDVSFVPMAAVSEEGQLLEVKTKKVGEVKKGFPHFKEKDVLVAKITPCFENGKRWLADSLSNGVGFGSTEFHVLRVSKKVLPEWIYYIVSLPDFRRDGQRRLTGTAGQKRVPASFLEEYAIPVPPLIVQEKIVRVLRRAEQLREVRERANQLTNKIIQSVFLKMFGNPTTNPKNWKTGKLGKLATRITKGESPKWQGFEYVPEGPLFIRSENVQWGYLDLSEQTRIPMKFYEKLSRSQLRPKDVLINLVGASIGRAAMVPQTIGDANVNQAVGVLSLGTAIRPEFLVQFLICPSVQKLIQQEKVDAARANISLTDLREMEVVVPPLELQDNFANAVGKLSSLMQKQQKSTQEINQLFHSLMQKAFGGQLVA